MKKTSKVTRFVAAAFLLLSACFSQFTMLASTAHAADLTVQAESYSSMSGINNDGTTIGGLDNGDWAAYANVNLGTGYSTFTASVAVAPTNAGQQIEIRLDSATGPLAGTLTVANTGSWTTYAEQSTTLTGASGTHTVYLKAVGTFGAANVDYFKFSGTASSSGVINPGFETGSLSPWTNSGNAAVVSTNAHSGTKAVNLGTSYSGVEQFLQGLAPNTTYQLTAWVKNAAAGDVIWFGVRNYGAAEVNTTTTSGAYTQVAVTFTTGSTNTTANMFIWKNDGTAASYADDVTLTPVPLQNPGFETGVLTPWTNTSTAAVVATNVHSGTKAVNIGTANSGIEQLVTGLTPNTSYTYSGWVKNSTAGDVTYIGVKNFGSAEVNTTTTASVYTKLSVTFTTGSTNTSALLFVWKSGGAAATYADDFTLAANPVVKYSGQNLGFNTQDPYFTSSSDINKLYDKVVSTGTKWVRATLFWDLMEPTQGTIDWTQADLIFNAIKSRGLKYDLVIRSAPAWAAGVSSTPDHNYAPTNGAAYGNICYQIAKRYLNRGVTITFELGNEQNMQFFNMPSVDPVSYTNNMLKPGSTGIRQAATELGIAAPTVLVGGFSPVEPAYVAGSVRPLDFMQAIYDNGGKGYFDTIAYHTYTYVSGSSTTHWTFTELQSIIDLMNSKGDTNRKVWATEVGWATGSGSGEVDEATQAAFTTEAFDVWYSLPYAGPMLWYELVDNSSYDNANRENTFGLLHSDAAWSEKPAYSAFLSKVGP